VNLIKDNVSTEFSINGLKASSKNNPPMSWSKQRH